jgi:hypothetical protein
MVEHLDRWLHIVRLSRDLIAADRKKVNGCHPFPSRISGNGEINLHLLAGRLHVYRTAVLCKDSTEIWVAYLRVLDARH